MPFLQDTTRFCLHCGTEVHEGPSRCPDCGRWARAPRMIWVGVLGAAGVASGLWAWAKGASGIAALVSAVASAVLGAGGIHYSMGNPNSPGAGRRGSWPRTALGILLMVEAVAVPAYWGVSAKSGAKISVLGMFVITFVVLPVLIVPLATVSMRRGWGAVRYIPTCDACGAYVTTTARFCSACGKAR